MPFEEIETITKHNTPPTALITYMRSKARGKNTGKEFDRSTVKPQLHITIPTTICGAIKSEKFKLLVGTGADKGKARIKGDNKSPKAVKPHEFKHAFTFKFGFVPKLGDEIFDNERVAVRRIGEDEFEIDLPKCWDAA